MSTLAQAVDTVIAAIKANDVSTARNHVANDTLEWWAGAAFSQMVDVEKVEESDGTGRARVAIYSDDGTVDIRWSNWKVDEYGDWFCESLAEA